MNIKEAFAASKVFHLLWIFAFLGSCTYIKTTDNRTLIYGLELTEGAAPADCTSFKRMVRLNHTRPRLPRVDIGRLNQDEVTELLLEHTEKVKEYLDNEEKFLQEDIRRYNLKCSPQDLNVFEK